MKVGEHVIFKNMGPLFDHKIGKIHSFVKVWGRKVIEVPKSDKCLVDIKDARHLVSIKSLRRLNHAGSRTIFEKLLRLPWKRDPAAKNRKRKVA